MIGIISGSQRLNSQTQKVAEYLKEVLNLKFGQESEIFELSKLDLPWKEVENQKNIDINLVDKVNNCTSFIVICPEWNGTVTPILTNFFMLFPKNTFAHKPALIAAVSANLGGSFVINSLRNFSYKNTYLNYIPEHLIIRQVKEFCNSFDIDKPAEELPFIEQRIQFALNLLISYSKTHEILRKDLLNSNVNGEYFFNLSQNGMS
jgi:NAD(P)H-dependent FMN reductase